MKSSVMSKERAIKSELEMRVVKKKFVQKNMQRNII